MHLKDETGSKNKIQTNKTVENFRIFTDTIFI